MLHRRKFIQIEAPPVHTKAPKGHPKFFFAIIYLGPRDNISRGPTRDIMSGLSYYRGDIPALTPAKAGILD